MTDAANIKKVTLINVVVHREVDGKTVRVHPPIGKTFMYTEKEVKEIGTANKQGLRDPVNEDPDTDRDEVIAQVNADKTAEAASLAASGKKQNKRAAAAAEDNDI